MSEPRPIGYYVHHHGDGHRRRALAIAARQPGRFVLIGTALVGRTEGLACLDLPDDRLDGTPDEDLDGSDDHARALHYAPLDHDGIRRRTAAIAAWIASVRPALLVVDVSAEIAMLARLASVPTAYVRLNGRRKDPPHLEAFRSARSLIAPFSAELDDDGTPAWVRRKTAFFPGIAAAADIRPAEPGRVAVVFGKGGPPFDGRRLAEASRATPNISWRALGPLQPISDPPANLALLGWVDAAEPEIAAAEIVVGAPGDGLVSAVAAAGKPFVAVIEPRPFDEQRLKAERLRAAGAAIVLDGWPEASRWPSILTQARALDPSAMRRLHDPGGAAKAAAHLVACADGNFSSAARISS